MFKFILIFLGLFLIVVIQLYGVNSLFSFPTPSLALMFILALVWVFDKKNIFYFILFSGLLLDILSFSWIGRYTLFFLGASYLFYWIKKSLHWNKKESNNLLAWLLIIIIYVIFVFWKILTIFDKAQIIFLIQKVKEISIGTFIWNGILTNLFLLYLVKYILKIIQFNFDSKKNY